MAIFTAMIHYRNEKPYGVGKTAHERHTRIEPGYRAEIVDGLEKGWSVYTGVCESKAAAVAELVSELKRLGLNGTLRLAR